MNKYLYFILQGSVFLFFLLAAGTAINSIHQIGTENINLAFAAGGFLCFSISGSIIVFNLIKNFCEILED